MCNFSSLLNIAGIPTNAINNVTITDQDPILPSPFLIGEAGATVIAAVGYAASELWYLKTKRRQQIEISVKDAAVMQRSHEYFRVLDGENQPLWSPLSGFYKTGDHRWIQLHCNFPHHQQGVIDLLQCDNSKQAVAEAVKHWQAGLLEELLARQGMCAAMVRTADEWHAHPQYKAIQSLPLLEIIKIGDSAPEPLPLGNRLLSGIKVLDLTRVIAGPICGRTLAEHGATVMLISSPNLPFILPLVMDTGHGKLSAWIDLDQPEEKEKIFHLIQDADIFAQSYRPGSLASRGLSPQDLAKIRPGIIYISLSAYSHVGPWADWHGYDSLVQSATGIAFEQGGQEPRHLPTQSLDYLTGYLAALGAIEALRRRALNGGSYLVRVSLAQTAQWFQQLGRVASDFSQCVIPSRADLNDLLITRETAFGKLEYLKPLLKMSETPLYWEREVMPLGSHVPRWP